MGRTQTFISALVIIALMAAWYMHGPELRAAWKRVNAAKTAKSATATGGGSPAKAS